MTRKKVLHKIDECKNGSGSDEQSCARKESFHLRNTFYRQKRPMADISCLKNNDLGNVCARPGLDNMLLF